MAANPRLRELLHAYEAASTEERVAALDALRGHLAGLRLQLPLRDTRELPLAWRFAGREQELEPLLARLSRAAGTALPVLIVGPPGAGAAAFAHAIHSASPKRGEPFCAWDPRDEAPKAGGLWVSAEPLPGHALTRLRGALGGPARLFVEAGQALTASGWGEALGARLSVHRLDLPPLPRALAPQVVSLAAGRALSPEVEARLQQRAWTQDSDEALSLGLALSAGEGLVALAELDALLPAPQTLEALERRAILARLEQFGWQQAETARSLGIDRKTLYRKIRRYGLTPA